METLLSNLSFNAASSPLITPQLKADYSEFAGQVFLKTGIDLRLYKEAQMLRRLYNLVERAGCVTFREYGKQLERDPAELQVLLDRITINVSELFRNADKWKELQEQILPSLLRSRPSLKLWSAGCSNGAEPYSLMILLDLLKPNQPHTIHATDLDQNILKRAREGRFTQNEIALIDAEKSEPYFSPVNSPSLTFRYDASPLYEIKPRFRERVQFRCQNLLADEFESDYDLILCRNVVIYFTDEAKEHLYKRFFEALAPGGYLFVGGTERIFHYGRIGFEMPLPFFYRKPFRRDSGEK